MPSEKRTINIRFDDEMYEAIERMAVRSGVSRSETVRLIISGQLSRLATTKLSDDNFKEYLSAVRDLRGDVGQLESQLVRIGNNVNQMARKVHQTDYLEKAMLDEIKSQLEFLELEIQRLVAKHVTELWP